MTASAEQKVAAATEQRRVKAVASHCAEAGQIPAGAEGWSAAAAPVRAPASPTEEGCRVKAAARYCAQAGQIPTGAEGWIAAAAPPVRAPASPKKKG
jgi:hypothetical protein